MNRGYVRLWRKSLDAGWIKNHKLWAFWTYCLMKATHKEYDAIIGLQVIHLMPGQFIFGLKKASQETGLTVREIRTIVEFLRKAGNLTNKTTNKFSIITIINWPIYQGDNIENDTQNDKPLANKGQHTNTRTHKNKIFLSESIEIRLAELLLEKIIYRNPNYKKPNLQSWAKDIDLMIRIDKREPSEISKVVEWCQQDQFWQSNILSTAKLRKQYDQLKAKMQSTGAIIQHRTPITTEAFECSQCGHSIIVKSDLTENGCVYCENKATEV